MSNENVKQVDPQSMFADSNMKNPAALLDKWKGLIEFHNESIAPIKSYKTKLNTAILLENQNKALYDNGYMTIESCNGVCNSGAFGNYGASPNANATAAAYGGVGSRGGWGPGSHYQYNGSPQHPNDFYAPGDARVPTTLLPMVRRVFPELLANELFSVQPMSTPVGLVFGLRYKYSSNPLSCLGPNDSFCPTQSVNGAEGWWSDSTKEAGYQYLNTAQTGVTAPGLTGLGVQAAGATAAGSCFDFLAEDRGVAQVLSYFECSNKIPSMTLEIEKTAVEAGTRRISSKWCLELEQDLKAMHNLDIDNEMVSALSYELQAEIDRELLNRAIQVCLNAGIGKGFSFWKPQAADGRWMAERNAVLYAKILRESQLIAIRNRLGSANWIVATPSVVSLLQLLPQFKNFEIGSSIDPKIGTARVGTLGNFRVYQDTRTEAQYLTGARVARLDYILLGYLGGKPGESGIVFAPYIPAMIQRTVGPNDFSPRIGMITRYGVVDHLFGASLFYHLIIIKDLDQMTTCAGCAPTDCSNRIFQ